LIFKEEGESLFDCVNLRYHYSEQKGPQRQKQSDNTKTCFVWRERKRGRRVESLSKKGEGLD